MFQLSCRILIGWLLPRRVGAWRLLEMTQLCTVSHDAHLPISESDAGLQPSCVNSVHAEYRQGQQTGEAESSIPLFNSLKKEKDVVFTDAIEIGVWHKASIESDSNISRMLKAFLLYLSRTKLGPARHARAWWYVLIRRWKFYSRLFFIQDMLEDITCHLCVRCTNEKLDDFFDGDA